MVEVVEEKEGGRKGGREGAWMNGVSRKGEERGEGREGGRERESSVCKRARARVLARVRYLAAHGAGKGALNHQGFADKDTESTAQDAQLCRLSDSRRDRQQSLCSVHDWEAAPL